MLTTPGPGELLAPIFRDARDTLMLAWAGLRAPSVAALATAAALGDAIHRTEQALSERLGTGPDDGTALRLVPRDIERITGAIDGLVRSCQLMAADGTTFTARAMREVNALFERAVELLECTADLSLTGNRVLARHVEVESVRIQGLLAEYAQAHEERIEEGTSHPSSSSTYLGILDYLREITRQSRLIASRIGPRPAPGEGPLFRA